MCSFISSFFLFLGAIFFFTIFSSFKILEFLNSRKKKKGCWGFQIVVVFWCFVFFVRDSFRLMFFFLWHRRGSVGGACINNYHFKVTKQQRLTFSYSVMFSSF